MQTPTTNSMRARWSEKYQTFTFEGAADEGAQTVEIFEVGTGRFLGYQTTDDDWSGD